MIQRRRSLQWREMSFVVLTAVANGIYRATNVLWLQPNQHLLPNKTCKNKSSGRHSPLQLVYPQFRCKKDEKHYFYYSNTEDRVFNSSYNTTEHDDTIFRKKIGQCYRVHTVGGATLALLSSAYIQNLNESEDCDWLWLPGRISWLRTFWRRCSKQTSDYRR